jgi:hypothetical protein
LVGEIFGNSQTWGVFTMVELDKGSTSKQEASEAELEKIESVASGMPTGIPAKATDAPKKIDLPGNVNTAMRGSFANSFPNGHSQERCATLVTDKDSKIKVLNEKSGTSSSSSPNRTVGADEKIIGTYHTHPYDKDEGGYRGVSFSSGDILYAIHYSEPTYVDAGSKQFMIMPTGETGQVERHKLDAEYSEAFSANSALQFPDRVGAVVKLLAKMYKLVYYEGSNGILSRAIP